MTTDSKPPRPNSHKAVVVGGAGFLGRRLVHLLAGEADETAVAAEWPRFDAIEVVDVSSLVPDENLAGLAARTGRTLTSTVADVRDEARLARAFEGAHTVFHLASVVDVGLRKNPLIEAVNVGGARNVVAACHRAGVSCLVYTSSEDVVLSETPVAGGDERLPYPTHPIHDYVRTKIEGEKVVLAANGTHGLATCALRPVHLYGPADPHAITVSLKELASGKVFFVLGDGTARFDIVYVDNVAHAHLLAARRLADVSTRGTIGGEAFFVNEGNAPNYFEFLRPYAESRGIRIPSFHLRERPLHALATAMEFAHRIFGIDVPFHRFHLYVIGRDFYFSGEKARQLLGYRPIVPPAEGLRRTLDWLKDVDLD